MPADWVVRRPESMTAFDAMTLGTAGFTAALAIELMEHNGLEAATTARCRHRRDRRRRLGRDRDPRQARLPRRRDHRQGRGADYLQGDRREGSDAARSRSTSRKIRPLDKATWAGAVDNLGGDMLAWLLVDDEDRRHGRRRRTRRRACKLNTTVMPFILRGVHAARRRQRQLRRWRCGRRSGTSSPSNGGPTACTTRCARSTSTSCRRTSMPTSRAWCAAARSCASRADTHRALTSLQHDDWQRLRR